MKTLYYVADPMCSWCWGFQPVLEKVKEAVPEETCRPYISWVDWHATPMTPCPM